MDWSCDFQKGMDTSDNGDYATALKEWIPLAEKGHLHAMYHMGFIYKNGKGVIQDYKTVAKWWFIWFKN